MPYLMTYTLSIYNLERLLLTFTPTKLPVNYHLHVLYAKHLSILSQLISTHILIDMTSLLTSNTVLEVEDHARLS